MSKTTAMHFIDWENHVFGFGYRSGEEHILPALSQFLGLCREGEYYRQYDFQKLETALTPVVAWLLINILCHADIIEYGTSPRYGWLTKEGELLKDFIVPMTADNVVGLTCTTNEYVHCYPDHCNCDTPCNNPFWHSVTPANPR